MSQNFRIQSSQTHSNNKIQLGYRLLGSGLEYFSISTSIFVIFRFIFISYFSDIRKVEADVNTIEIDGNIKGYKFHNVTKYYENDIVFIAHEGKQINSLPVALLEQIEGCIVYFDSDNVCAN